MTNRLVKHITVEESSRIQRVKKLQYVSSSFRHHIYDASVAEPSKWPMFLLSNVFPALEGTILDFNICLRASLKGGLLILTVEEKREFAAYTCYSVD